MTYASEKPLKECPYCKKSYRDLPRHIITNHPAVIEQIEEIPAINQAPAAAVLPQNSARVPSSAATGDINSMIREKLDTMLNIKIIEMLSKGAELSDIQKAINPAPPAVVSIDDIKKYHDVIYKPASELNLNFQDTESSSSGDSWTDIIKGALPIVSELIKNKKQNEEEFKNVEHRGDEERDKGVSELIQIKAPEDRGESGNTSEESGSSSSSSGENDKSTSRID